MSELQQIKTDLIALQVKIGLYRCEVDEAINKLEKDL